MVPVQVEGVRRNFRQSSIFMYTVTLVEADELAQRLGVTLTEVQTPETYLLGDLLRREGLVLRPGERLRLGYSKAPLRDALVAELRLDLAAKAAPLPEEDQARRKRDLLAFVTREGAATVAAPWARYNC